MSSGPLPAWKPELDAVIGARHGGQASAIASRLESLNTRYPNIPDIAFQLGWTYETLNQPEQALPHYERAISLGLGPNDLSAAFIGLGNCLRAAGQAARAVETLESARRQFPEHREIQVFLGLALHAAGRHADATRLLIDVALETTEDPGLNAYQRAIRYHASLL